VDLHAIHGRPDGGGQYLRGDQMLSRKNIIRIHFVYKKSISGAFAFMSAILHDSCMALNYDVATWHHVEYSCLVGSKPVTRILLPPSRCISPTRISRSLF
jgi:hypothetical protein